MVRPGTLWGPLSVECLCGPTFVLFAATSRFSVLWAWVLLLLIARDVAAGGFDRGLPLAAFEQDAEPARLVLGYDRSGKQSAVQCDYHGVERVLQIRQPLGCRGLLSTFDGGQLNGGV